MAVIDEKRVDEEIQKIEDELFVLEQQYRKYDEQYEEPVGKYIK